ncbi:MAG: hypothetical protein NT031_03590 [Planctomycetota bacterium]|nr:hypothetical protein [Planctomycetota bacterium]
MAINGTRMGLTAAVLMLPIFWASAAQAAAGIAVGNFANGETIRYSTPLIIGSLADDKAQAVGLVNTSSKRPTNKMIGLAHKGHFKVLADLVPGENKLVISTGGASTSLTLTFKPQTNPYAVRAVFYTDKTGDAGYLSPKANDNQDVKGRLSTAMLLMQSFSAESMYRMGYGRKTFNVELEPDGTAKTFVVKGDQAPNSGLNMGAIDGAINAQAARGNTHYLVLTGRGMGYTAIGGGGKAMMGGITIYSWPDSIANAQAAFMDTTPIDSGKYHVDAVDRDVYWANSSTCIGACLHEIDHTFGLPHSMDGFCIMTRGIDYFNRFFTLVEPPSKTSHHAADVNEDQVARYCKVTANNLACNKFFALDDVKYPDVPQPEIIVDRKARRIAVKSQAGIAFIGIEVPFANPGADYCVPIDPKKPAPKEITLTAKDWKSLDGKQFQVRVIDVNDRGGTDRDPFGGDYGKNK